MPLHVGDRVVVVGLIDREAAFNGKTGELTEYLKRTKEEGGDKFRVKLDDVGNAYKLYAHNLKKIVPAMDDDEEGGLEEEALEAMGVSSVVIAKAGGKDSGLQSSPADQLASTELVPDVVVAEVPNTTSRDQPLS